MPVCYYCYTKESSEPIIDEFAACTCTNPLHYAPSLFSPRRKPGGHTTTDTSASEDDLTFSGTYQPKYNPPNDNMAALKEKKRQKNETNPLPDAYVNVTMMGTGPCTQSGVWTGASYMYM